MNTILQVQNEPQQLDRLAAQRQLYADAKRILAVQMFSTAFLSVALALWAAHDTTHPQVRVWAGVWGLGIGLLDQFLLTPWQKSLKKTASTIQEMFDCDVLQLPWKRGRNKVEAETIARAARRYERSVGQEQFGAKLKAWYPVKVESLPLPLARIVCQRSNVWWDAGLRRRYNGAVLVFVIVIFFVVMAYGVFQNPPFVELLKGVVLPLFPLLLLGGRQIWDNREAIETVNRLKGEADKLWGEALKGANDSVLTEKSRDFQDDLWDQRSKNPLIFEWIYNRLKRDDENIMNVGAEDLIKQAQKANQP